MFSEASPNMDNLEPAIPACHIINTKEDANGGEPALIKKSRGSRSLFIFNRLAGISLSLF